MEWFSTCRSYLVQLHRTTFKLMLFLDIWCTFQNQFWMRQKDLSIFASCNRSKRKNSIWLLRFCAIVCTNSIAVLQDLSKNDRFRFKWLPHATLCQLNLYLFQILEPICSDSLATDSNVFFWRACHWFIHFALFLIRLYCKGLQCIFQCDLHFTQFLRELHCLRIAMAF